MHTAIDNLGFVRNESARQLRAGRSRTLGLVVHSVSNPYFTDLSQGVDAIADEAGLAVILCNSDGTATKEQRYLALLEEQRVQALLITPINVSSARLVQLQRRGMAVVLLDKTSRRDDMCSVCVDDVTGGHLAASHLISAGHRRIAYVQGSPRTRQCRDRRVGAARAIRQADLPDETLTAVDVAGVKVSHGHAAGRRIATMRPRPTAVFCANDLLALGVLHAVTEEGLTVPDDVAIVGHDDIEIASSAPVPLTTVRQPRRLLGRTAAELARDEADAPGRHRHRRVIFQPELVVRTST